MTNISKVHVWKISAAETAQISLKSPLVQSVTFPVILVKPFKTLNKEYKQRIFLVTELVMINHNLCLFLDSLKDRQQNDISAFIY